MTLPHGLAISALLVCGGCAGAAPADNAAESGLRLDAVIARFWLEAPMTGGQPPGRRQVALVLPVALAASGNDLYIADRGLGMVLRYDLVLGTAVPVARGAECAVAPKCYLAAGRFAVLMAASHGGQAIASDYDGQSRRFELRAWAESVGGLASDERTGDWRVLDLLSGRSLILSRDGALVSSHDFESRLPSISAVSFGNQRWWLSDRASRVIAAYDLRGRRQDVWPALPFAVDVMAADEAGRLLVLDRANGHVALYDQGQRVASIADPRGEPRRFSGLESMAYSQGRYFLADAATATIQIWRWIDDAAN